MLGLLLCAVHNKLAAILCHCIYTCESALQGSVKMLGLLFCAAVQNKLTAVLCHCIYTCESPLLTQMCDNSALNSLQGFYTRVVDSCGSRARTGHHSRGLAGYAVQTSSVCDCCDTYWSLHSIQLC